MIGPASRLALGVHVLAAEEVCLDIHRLDIELTRVDLLLYILVARVEAAGVADHAGEAGFLGLGLNRKRVSPAIGQRDLDLHMLACVHAGDGLLGMHLRRGTQDHGIDVVERSEEHTSELQSLMRISYAVFCLKKKKKQESMHIQHRNHNNQHS